MIDREELKKFIEKQLEGSDMFLVDLSVSSQNDIKVELDSLNGVDIDECVKLTHDIESAYDRDKEDYELEVGSAGLTSPLKDKRQYQKFIGKDMELITGEGKKVKGILKEATDNDFVIEVEEKVKPEGSKRPVIEKKEKVFSYGDVKEIKYLLKF